MSDAFILTQDHPDVHGEFWIPGDDTRQLGFMRLEAGKQPSIELAEFTGLERSAFVERIRRDQSRRREDGHRVIHGIDEHGQPITLIDCHETASRSTRSRLTRSLSCHAAIFGAHLSTDDLAFAGVTFRLDHQDEWLDRSALGRVEHEPREIADFDAIRMFKIPVAESKSIALNLAGYRRSRFSLWWIIGPQHRVHTFEGRSYIDLLFEGSKSWDEVRAELSSWRRLFSLATRSNIGAQEIFLRRQDIPSESNSSELKLLPVWVSRSVGSTILHPKRNSHEFHFSFEHVESMFAEMHSRWRAIAEPWAAVLHRFVAISSQRELWVNEQFLFLAQAIESLHRARIGSTASITFLNAARQAWDESPVELQKLLGDRGVFSSTLRKSRNYWTHYGKPGPGDDPEVLDGDALIIFSEKLRWIVEAAILREIGIPEANVARVWGERWRLRFVNFA
jgi:ApeA N-terminal domain 1